MRSVATSVTDQTIVVHCFDSDEAAVTLTSGSAGLSMSYRLDTAGREGTPVSMTPIARSVAGVHEDGAITSKSNGKHEIDLPDAAFAAAGYLSVILSATSVTGRVYSEVIAVGEVAVLNTEGRTAIADAVDTKLSDTHGDGSWGGGGGSGGGSPVFTAVVVARIATGSAAGWPEDFTIGDAYLTENAGAQPLFIKDVADNILSGLGTKNFSDPDFVGALRLAPLTDGTRTLDTPPTTIEVKSTDDVGIVYNDDTAGAEYFELQIPRAKTLMGVTKTKYSCQFIMNWGIDNTFERTVNLGEIKFLRKNAPAT